MISTPVSEAFIPRAQAWLEQYFGVKGQLQALAGEVDYNFRVSTTDGPSYLLKMSRPGTAPTELAFQVAILEHLRTAHLPFAVPQLITTPSGLPYVEVKTAAGQKHYLRLQTWVPGRLLGEVQPRSAALLRQWGQTAAHLNLALQSFDHPYAHRAYRWDPSRTLESRLHQQWFTEQQKEIASFFWERFAANVLPQLAPLRSGINYNDAHEMNLLVSTDKAAPQICGVIDFGDALFTQTINELAITCAYAIMEQPDPLSAAGEVVQGFHQVAALEEPEIAILYDLIAARLLITVATAADNLRAEPENKYLQVSAQPAWEALEKWRSLPPTLVHYRLRAACGWEPAPQRAAFSKWLAEQPAIHPLMPLDSKRVVPLDLSVGSLDLGNNDRFLEIDPFCRTINELLVDQNAEFGVGGYREVRPFYTTDAYQVIGNEGAQWRTVHLGLDVWGAAHTPVYAPVAGQVYSVNDNAGERDYGPTLILQHTVNEELTFYTLYGHLSRASVAHLEAGQAVAAGDTIAALGSPPENGNWPPHLHFQVILDLLEEEGDFPGVCYPAERTTWLSLCPNPALLFPGLPQLEKDNWNSNSILAQRQRVLGRSLSTSYQEPLHIVRGFGVYLYDQNARRYLDTVNNVAHVGHEHPRVVRAAQRQIALLNTNTRYLHENVVRFAAELVDTLPHELSVVHFVNSGSEANELALRMAKVYSGQQDIIALEVGYHGNTGACIEVSSYKFDGPGGQGTPVHTHVAPMPDVYRGPFRDEATAGPQYAAAVGEILRQLAAEGKGVAAFLAESILSCGGQISLPTGYLSAVYEQVRASGGLCIADEVQVGFGRVGSHFWGFELQGVVPDIVTMGKPIGNGHPLAAVVTTEAVADAFANGMEFFNTFGGNPVSAAIGRTVLQIVQEEDLPANALRVGKYLRQGLLELQAQHPIIGDVRGPGFFQGLELVRDRTTLEPAATEASYLANRMRQRGILMSTDGPLHNVLKIKPPMCFGKPQADFLLENLDLVLRENMFH